MIYVAQKLSLVGLVIGIGLMQIGTTAAQSKYTQHTLQLDDNAKPATAKLEDFQWLVGRWVGTGLGGDCEETFSPIWNRTMVGTFRYAQDGQLVFSEYFSLVEEDGGMVLKLRHFNPNFTGWEEKDKCVNFPLIKVENQTAHFGGLTYQRIDDDTLKVWVAMRNSNDNTMSETAFEFKLAIDK